MASGSITANWLDQPQRPSERDLKEFLTGSSITIGAGNFTGGSLTISPGYTTAYGTGYFTPLQAGGSYNWTPSFFTFKN